MSPFLILLTILIGGVSSTTNFNMTLTSKESRCIYEFFADNTLVIIILESDSKEISVSLLDPNQASLYNEFLTDQYIKLAFTTYDGGYFAICLTSNSKQTANLKFNIKHGIAAKDYSEVSKLRHLKPIELELQKLDYMTEQLNHLQGFSISHEKVYNVLYENLTSRIAYYSVGVVGIMAAVAFVQSYYLTKFINNKKLI